MKKKYFLEEDDKWIFPETLKKQEELERNKSVAESNNEGDFGSYKQLLNGMQNSNIESHNNSIGINAKINVAIFKKVVSQFGIISPKIIGDMGCGAGFITAEIEKQFSAANVYGYDVSVDAIRYAQKEFPKVNFNVMAIEPGAVFTVKFDIIYAHEFYPFTRTNSLEFEMSFLETFLDNLNDGGLLVIGLCHTRKCLLNQLTLVKQKIEKKVTKLIMPSKKIYRLIPQLFFAQVLTFIINKIFNKKMSYFVVIKK